MKETNACNGDEELKILEKLKIKWEMVKGCVWLTSVPPRDSHQLFYCINIDSYIVLCC